MKVLAFFPLTYLAGIHGFAMFAPYAALFVAAAHVLRWSRKSRVAKPALISIPVTHAATI
jgi:hypothetical protein